MRATRELGWLLLLTLVWPLPAHAISFGSPVPDATFDQEFSWAVGIFTGGSLCTGQFITTDLVLTAAHCVAGVPGGSSVFAGSAELSQASVLSVAETFVHPDYDPGSLQFDSAILRLAAPFAVTPVRIATAAESAALLVNGANADIAGWGESSPFVFPDRLRAGTTQLASLGASGTLIQFGGQPLPCQGDSGGPLLIAGPDAIPRLVGTSSFTIGPCGSAVLVGYTRTSSVQGFIDATIAATQVPAPSALWLFASVALFGATWRARTLRAP